VSKFCRLNWRRSRVVAIMAVQHSSPLTALGGVRILPPRGFLDLLRQADAL
jgi:hypothetical protein